MQGDIHPLLTLILHFEQDVVAARQRARQIAELLGFESQDQTRLATAVSEIARNAFRYAGGGRVAFGVTHEADHPLFLVEVRDRGPGIPELGAVLEGRFRSRSGLGMGIQGVRRIMDVFRIESAPEVGTTVSFGKRLPPGSPPMGAEQCAALAQRLAGLAPQTPIEEVQQQNQAVLLAMDEARQRERAQKFLARASEVLAGSLELETVLQRIAELAVPALADLCLVDLVDEQGETHRTAAARSDRVPDTLLARLRSIGPGSHPDHPVNRALLSREPVRVSSVTDSWIDVVAATEEHRRLIREVRPTAVLAVPMVSREQALGVLTFARVGSQAGYDAAALALAGDLAHRAVLAVENARLYHQAQQATRARDEVLGIVSHDLRNPLNTIFSSASFLLDVLAEADPQLLRGQLSIIRRSAERMNRLIEDLLDVTRIEAGRLSINRIPIPLRPLVLEVVEGLRTAAVEGRIELRAEVEPDLPPVPVDGDRVCQVLSNLIGNALKFTPAGGSIVVRARAAGEEVQLSVSDTGSGIPAEHLPRLFDRFWQMHRGDRRGAGLGLAITRGIVEAHGGRIWVESEPGAGTTFRLTLPLAEPGAGPEAPPAALSAGGTEP